VIAHAERAIACGASGERLGNLRMLVGEAHWWTSERIQARAQWSEAITLFSRGSSRWCRAAAGLIMVNVQLCDIEAFAALARQVEELEPSLSAQASPAPRLGMLVPYLCAGGRYDLASKILKLLERDESVMDAIDLSELGLARCTAVVYANASPWARLNEAVKARWVCEQTREPRRAMRAILFQAQALVSMGSYVEAERILREAIAQSGKIHAPFFASIAEQHLAVVLLETGRVEEAQALARRALTAHLKTHNLHLAASVRLTLSTIHLHEGELGDALLEAEEGLRGMVVPHEKAEALGVLASVRLARGEGHLALPLAEEAITLLETLGTIPEGAALVRFTYAKALEATSRTADARKAHASARAQLLATAATIEVVGLRRTFLEGVALHRQILASGAIASG
jgi:tetratricopeptide (TPR) repeat protein